MPKPSPKLSPNLAPDTTAKRPDYSPERYDKLIGTHVWVECYGGGEVATVVSAPHNHHDGTRVQLCEGIGGSYMMCMRGVEVVS